MSKLHLVSCHKWLMCIFVQETSKSLIVLRTLSFVVHQHGSPKHTHTQVQDTHSHTLTHAHVHSHSRERKLQHNDKVWEHNGLSGAQTPARTSLAPKGQQASPGFHSVPPVIIVQLYNDYSDGLYFANVGSHPEIPKKYENAGQTGEDRGKRLLMLKGELL